MENDVATSDSQSAGHDSSGKGPIIAIISFGVIALAVVVAVVLALINSGNSGTAGETIDGVSFSEDNWSYDATNDVYYQIGVSYVDKPVSSDYETMGIYVPGEYLSCNENGEKYKCEVNKDGAVGNYTAETAPMVMPVNTPGYAAQSAPTSYNYKTAADYVEAGMVYLYPGCRGRISGGGPATSKTTEVDFATGAPWGVTDLKAAVRYVRYNSGSIPGDTEAIFAFGMSGGGAQTAVLGASGDSALYTPYLEEIGAKMNYDDGTAISDAIAGANAWCPITELTIADAAYEWNMGQYTRNLTDWTAELSSDLVDTFVGYINRMEFVHDGKTLKLTNRNAGSYYDYIMSVAERSLNNYLKDNYSSESDRASYVAGLGSWAKYNDGVAKITDFAGFIKSEKPATKSVPAFDGLSLGQAENEVFANDENQAMHFDHYLYELFLNNDYDTTTDYKAEFKNSMEYVDAEGSSQWKRVLMYTPTVYLMDYPDFGVDGKESVPAKYWRIRSGLSQGDTAMTTEVNLALALEAAEGVESVDFETVWGEGHTEAERTGKATSNFIKWVGEMVK